MKKTQTPQRTSTVLPITGGKSDANPKILLLTREKSDGSKSRSIKVISKRDRGELHRKRTEPGTPFPVERGGQRRQENTHVRNESSKRSQEKQFRTSRLESPEERLLKGGDSRNLKQLACNRVLVVRSRGGVLKN